MPTAVLEDLAPRIKKAADEHREAVAAAKLRLKAVKKLVVQAVDEGMSQRAIAAAAGYKSAGRVTQILAEGDDD